MKKSEVRAIIKEELQSLSADALKEGKDWIKLKGNGTYTFSAKDFKSIKEWTNILDHLSVGYSNDSIPTQLEIKYTSVKVIEA